MTWSADTAYNELPLLPPALDLETIAVLKALVPARAALSGLNEALISVPNPGVFVNSLALLEAQASSEIENIVTTTDELFSAAAGAHDVTASTREALRYRSALYAGVEAQRERHGLITSNLAAKICTEIRGSETRIRIGDGTFIGNPVTRRRIYTPPSGEAVIAEKLANWEEFVNTYQELDPLVAMAAAHYQFEAIHPFDDGNGRTGRILNVLMLVASGLLAEPILYISQFIIANKNRYYELLNAVTAEEKWEEWTIYMVGAIQATAEATLAKIKEIQRLLADMRAVIADQFGTAPVNLADVLFEQPYCRIRDVVEQCAVSRPTATKYLRELASAGLLEEVSQGKEKVFVNRRFMETLKSVRSEV